jgi:hypothetical protein
MARVIAKTEGSSAWSHVVILDLNYLMGWLTDRVSVDLLPSIEKVVKR